MIDTFIGIGLAASVIVIFSVSLAVLLTKIMPVTFTDKDL